VLRKPLGVSGWLGEDLAVDGERVARQFGLGRLVAEPVAVGGGLSNEMWRLVTESGVFAVKRMIVNADRPDFVGNVEASFAVERRAWAAGVAMPEPVPEPSTGRALARVDGGLFRVHRWVEGTPGVGSAAQAARLLASIHAAGEARWESVPAVGWKAAGWGWELGALAGRVALASGRVVPGPGRALVVDSHRDLDRKNTLTTAAGVLAALDWDAAGPICAVHEAVGLALDWADGDDSGFAAALRTYCDLSGVLVPAEPWVFAGWVEAQGEWLDYNATHRADTALGQAEVAATSTRLHHLAASLDTLLAAIPRPL